MQPGKGDKNLIFSTVHFRRTYCTLTSQDYLQTMCVGSKRMDIVTYDIKLKIVYYIRT